MIWFWNKPNRWAYWLQLLGLISFLSGLFLASRMPRTGFFLAVFGFAISFGHFLGNVAISRMPRPPVYRQVIARGPNGLDGETVHLDCGHTVRLVYNRRDSIPCPDCAEALNNK
jgi:hypothetical protein